MYSAGQQRAKNANVDFLTARMRAKKNGVITYLDSLYEDERVRVINWAIKSGRQKRKAQKQKQSDVRKELSRRAEEKRQKRMEKARKQLEKQLQKADINNISTVFPDLSDATTSTLKDILNGTIIGRDICHNWYDSHTNAQSTWNRRIEKLRTKKHIPFYKIAYWGDDETYENAMTMMYLNGP